MEEVEQTDQGDNSVVILEQTFFVAEEYFSRSNVRESHPRNKTYTRRFRKVYSDLHQRSPHESKRREPSPDSKV
ncbi:hypothetical protein LCGC14_1638910 [marine sediment metagenome]|uniref:Uncharacterized protein n=1 Tax=marine sediment metagenome TaxID=412755 RepID=A0A0F9I0T0_9ZZZZ|nr:hypothetical protein [bacterium]